MALSLAPLFSSQSNSKIYQCYFQNTSKALSPPPSILCYYCNLSFILPLSYLVSQFICFHSCLISALQLILYPVDRVILNYSVSLLRLKFSDEIQLPTMQDVGADLCLTDCPTHHLPLHPLHSTPASAASL